MCMRMESVASSSEAEVSAGDEVMKHQLSLGASLETNAIGDSGSRCHQIRFPKRVLNPDPAFDASKFPHQPKPHATPTSPGGLGGAKTRPRLFHAAAMESGFALTLQCNRVMSACRSQTHPAPRLRVPSG
jgi:hypothetical protein